MNIIPTPKKIEMGNGSFSLCETKILLNEKNDSRLTYHAHTLRSEIEALTNTFVKVAAREKCSCKNIYISHDNKEDEGYTLTITDKNIEISGNSAAGAFYGIQTLRQIIKDYGRDIPVCTVTDKPDMQSRGFYHDVTRGKVPTLEQLKKIADKLAYFKINSLQLYVEDAFDFEELDGVMEKYEVLTAKEIIELDDYCYNNFIEFVPSLSTFGHLYNLLQSEKYKHLCEFENYVPREHYWPEKMGHHTIDVSNDESIEVIKSLIDQYVPLFRSNKFNICCDETFDLCQGKNRGKDKGEAYFGFLMKIINHLKSKGKTVMMWGDIVLEHPEKMSELPEGTIMLNWSYDSQPNEENVKTFAKAGLPQIVCPGTSTWNRFVEEIDRSAPNICKLAEYGYENGAIGLLNTNWGDFGNTCSFNCSLYGMLIGAEKSWNIKGELTPEFEQKASFLLYDKKDVNVIDMIIRLGRCERTCEWVNLVYWYSERYCIGNKEKGLHVESCYENVQNWKKADILAEEFRKLGDDERFTDLRLAAEMISFLNRLFMRVNGAEEFADTEKIQKEFNEWFKEYEAAWLRDNKKSQIGKIKEFMDEVVTIIL